MSFTPLLPIVLAALVAACAPSPPGSKPGDTNDIDTGADSADTGDSSTSDTAGICASKAAPGAVCYGLTQPWPLSTPAEARTALGQVFTGIELTELPWDDANAYGCPTLTVGEDYVQTLTGGCTTPTGVAYAGTFTFDSASVSSTYLWTFADFTAAAADGTIAWRADGTLSLGCVGCDQSWITVALDVAIDHDGSSPLPRGLRTVRGTDYWLNGTSQVALTFHVVQSDAGAGDFCYEEYANPWACPDEYDGFQSIQGDTRWTLTWDGLSECEGCGCETIDGEDAGTPCEWATGTTTAANGGGVLDPCNGVDDDGDGVVDEGTALAYFPDGDGDSFGAGAAVVACSAPSGFVSNAGDCDDAESTSWPAALEACGDGIDQDCDGADTPCWIPGAVGPSDAVAALHGPQAEAHVGADLTAADLDGDGAFELIVASAAREGRVVVVGSGAVGAVGISNVAAAWFATDDNGGEMKLATVARDTGGAAVVMGFPSGTGGGLGYGVVYVWDGPFTGESVPASATATLLGSATNGAAGGSVGAAGDLDGDGMSDLIVGGHSSTYAATAYILPSTVTGVVALGDFTALVADETRTVAVAAVPAGDVNGNGVADLWLAADGSDRAAEDGGAVYLVTGPVSGIVDVTGEPAVLGSTFREMLGQALVGAGDVDGDGYDDLLVGASPYASYEGRAWLISGAGFATGNEVDVAMASIESTGGTEVLGAAVGLHDADGDGFADVVVGAPTAGTGGAVLGWRGPLAGKIDDTSAEVAFVGTRAGGRVGEAFAAVEGTLWAIGAPSDDTAASGAGMVWLVDLPW